MKPVPNLMITVHGLKPVHNVESAVHGRLPFNFAGEQLQLTLSLDATDFLMIR
jgi:hypothetical protein